MSAALSAVVSEVVGIAVVAAAGIVAVAAVEIVAAADRKLRPDVGGKPDVAAQQLEALAVEPGTALMTVLEPVR